VTVAWIIAACAAIAVALGAWRWLDAWLHEREAALQARSLVMPILLRDALDDDLKRLVRAIRARPDLPLGDRRALARELIRVAGERARARHGARDGAAHAEPGRDRLDHIWYELRRGRRPSGPDARGA
jgi:hypothetical protein